jgi:hypothetical protein
LCCTFSNVAASTGSNFSQKCGVSQLDADWRGNGDQVSASAACTTSGFFSNKVSKARARAAGWRLPYFQSFTVPSGRQYPSFAKNQCCDHNVDWRFIHVFYERISVVYTIKKAAMPPPWACLSNFYLS